MSVNSVLYANARVSARLEGMLTAERYQRLLDAEDPLALLRELGWQGTTEEEMMREAVDSVYAFLREAAPVESGKQAFLKRNDYHNAKLFMKGKYLRREVPAALLYLDSLEDTVALKDAVLSDRYEFLPSPMAKALEEIDSAFAQGDRRSKKIDCLLTNAMYADLLETLAPCRPLREIVQKEIDFCNLSVLLRVRSHKLSAATLAEELLEGGTLSKESLTACLDLSEDGLMEQLRYSGYAAFVQTALADLKGSGALPLFERDSENALMAEYRRERGKAESPLYFFGYVYARLAEVKNVRIVLAGRRAELPQAKIRERMRDLYV